MGPLREDRKAPGAVCTLQHPLQHPRQAPELGHAPPSSQRNTPDSHAYAVTPHKAKRCPSPSLPWSSPLILLSAKPKSRELKQSLNGRCHYETWGLSMLVLFLRAHVTQPGREEMESGLSLARAANVPMGWICRFLFLTHHAKFSSPHQALAFSLPACFPVSNSQ